MLLAGAVALATAPFASAVPTLYFDIGDDGIIDGSAVVDQTGSDGNGNPGTVSFNFSMGGFSIIVGGSTKPSLGTATDLQSVINLLTSAKQE